MINLKQIFTDLSAMAFEHTQINSYGIGTLPQFTMDIDGHREPSYVRMYVVPGVTTLLQNEILYNFTIIIADRLEEDISNQKDVLNDTHQICSDIFTMIKQSYTEASGEFSLDYESDFGATLQPFLDNYETVLAGWKMNIAIRQQFDYNSCIIPMDGLTLPTSTTNINFKQMISDLEQIGTKHKQINSYGFGDTHQFTMDIETKREPVYTKMYAIPFNSVLAKNSITYDFDIIIADRLEEDLSNQVDVLNDTLEIVKDVFSVLYRSEYQADFGASVTPFLDARETVLAGWTLAIKLNIPFDYNRCDLPTVPFDTKTWNEVQELWNNVDIDWDKI